MEKKLTFKSFIVPIIVTVVMLAFCLVVFLVDVKPIGPNGTTVGLATVNGTFASAVPFNEILYNISDVLGLLSIIGVAIFACMGFVQLVKGGFKGVDKEIYALGGIFLLIFLLYLAFNEMALNFRPMIMPGETELEASFPSSHTMMACTVMGAIIVALPTYLKNKKLVLALRILCLFVLTGTVLCRLFSGVHWATDIIAGLLISMTLLSYFKVIYKSLEE